jgi:glycine/serine hydroxymethyltransferase
VYHARNGYVFSDAPIELMPNGMAFFTMVQGNPLEHIIENAKDSARISAQQEEHERQRSIREEAKRLVEDEKRVALAKQVAAIKAEQARQIAALEKAAAEAIAAL